MRGTTQAALAVALIVSIAALVVVGLRVAPIEQASNSAEARNECKVEAPDELQQAATEWCDLELFASMLVTAGKENVVAIANFNPNGDHVWQLQQVNLLESFKQLTDKMAARADGKSIAVSLHTADQTRVAGCARLTSQSTATCEVRK